MRRIAVGLTIPACIALAATAALPGRVAAGPPVSFAKGPMATRAGGQVAIEFAVSRPSDVAVSICDSKGRIVRHLAAGVLGPNAPAPLAAGPLEQAIAWDGTDDLGRPAAGGPFRATVSVGLVPSLGGFIGDCTGDVGGVRGLAPGPDGGLYVLHAYGGHHPHDAFTGCCVFGRDGRYLRTLIPYPADLPEGRLAGLKRIALEGGATVPFIYQVETLSMVPGMGDLPVQRPVVTRDGRLAFVGILEGPAPFANPDEARLVVIDTDGGVPAGGPLKTRVCPASDSGASLALSVDQRMLYAAGLRIGEQANKPGPHPKDYNEGETWTATRLAHAVYRFGWDHGRAQVFLGDPDKPGAGPAELNAPKGVAVDGRGNVYVADSGKNRIAVFRPDGAPLAQIPVDKPLRVEVHRKTGAIYILCDGKRMRIVRVKLAYRLQASCPIPRDESRPGAPPDPRSGER